MTPSTLSDMLYSQRPMMTELSDAFHTVPSVVDARMLGDDDETYSRYPDSIPNLVTLPPPFNLVRFQNNFAECMPCCGERRVDGITEWLKQRVGNDSIFHAPGVMEWICCKACFTNFLKRDGIPGATNDKKAYESAEKQWMKMLISTYSNGSGNLGEVIVDAILKMAKVSYTMQTKFQSITKNTKTNKNKTIISDGVIHGDPGCILEIKMSTHYVGGTANEKVPGIPCKYQKIENRNNRPLIVVLIADTERYYDEEMYKCMNQTPDYVDYVMKTNTYFVPLSTLMASLLVSLDST